MMASLAGAGTFTETTVEKFSESFSDESFLCQTELYQISVTGHSMTHLNARTDNQGNLTAPFRFTEVVYGRVTAVPLDGTGTSYRGHFISSDLVTVRVVKDGVPVETDTDYNMVVAKGSDGSQVRLREHHHFTVNGNGDISIEFDKFSSRC
jgi:hypothetical protein